MTPTEKWLFGGFLLQAMVLISRGPNSMLGDAPHYVAISHSIVHDQDLDLSNQYSPQGGYIFYPGPPEGHARPGRGGRLYSIHYIGFPIAAAPFFWLAEQFALRTPETVLNYVSWNRERACRDLLSVAMALLYSWTAVLTHRAARRLCSRQALTTLATVLAFGAPPLVCMSILVFTEIPAAFLLVWFLGLMLRPKSAAWWPLVPLAILPWIHLRYAPVALIAFVWVAVRVSKKEKDPINALRILLPIPLVSALLFALLELWMFGTVLPFAQYGEALPLGTNTLLPGLMGLLLDRDFGLLTVAPFWVIALATIMRPVYLPAAYIAFAGSCFLGSWVVAALHPMWWGGFSPPARFLLPVLPVLVPMLAEGLGGFKRGWKRGLLCVHLVWAGTMAALLIARPFRLWADTDTATGLVASLRPMYWVWPSILDPELSLTRLLGSVLIIVLLAVPAFTTRASTEYQPDSKC